MASLAKKKAIGVLALLLLDWEEKNRNKRRNRRVWVRGWIARRQEMGAFHRIVRELAMEDPSSFMEYLRMDEGHFNHLVSLVSPLIKKEDTCMREAISPAERVALTLRFLATGESLHSLAFQFRISRHAISYIVDETCAAITEVIGKEFMQVPQSKEQWLRVREKFYERWNFPNCLGAIDGKHIIMLQPAKSGSHYRNYKGSDSVVLLVIVGPNYEFLYVDVGANGRMSDGGIWNRCKFKESLVSTANPLDIPDPAPLPSRCKPVPYVIVGDDAFGLTEYLMKPFPKAQLTNDENRIYNYRLSRCRRISENAFGILAKCWGVFQKPIPLDPHKTSNIVFAATSLHNWLRSETVSCHIYSPPGMLDADDTANGTITPGSWRQDQPTNTWFPYIAEGSNNHSLRAKLIREEFKEYFNNEGVVSWQWRMCGLH